MSSEVDFSNDTLTITRVYDAPREAVFDAWVAVSKVEKWWGCDQTSATQSEIEPRVGGKYNHRMTHTMAGEFMVEGTFTVFDPPAKLAYRVGVPTMEEQPTVESNTVTVEFTDMGGKTRVRLTHGPIHDPMAREHVPHGWSAAFEKLDKFLLASV